MVGAVAVSGCAGWKITFVFVTLTVRPISLYASEKASRVFCRSASVWAAIAQSSAYCKSTMDVDFTFVLALRRRMLNSSPSVRYMIHTPLAWSTAAGASDIKAARNIANSVGAITQPCFTPVLMLNDPDCSPSYSTHTFMPSCSCRVMLTNVGGHPSRARHANRESLFTESNALVRSIHAKQRSHPCSLHFSCTCRAEKIMSVVPRPGLKPHYVSGIILSERACSRSRRTFARIFPATESREIPR